MVQIFKLKIGSMCTYVHYGRRVQLYCAISDRHARRREKWLFGVNTEQRDQILKEHTLYSAACLRCNQHYILQSEILYIA